jgi:SAM-dependent methyltransferase
MVTEQEQYLLEHRSRIAASRLSEVLACPRCLFPLTADGSRCADTNCDLSHEEFPLVIGQRVYFDPAKSIFDPKSVEPANDAPPGLARKILGVFARPNTVASRIAARLLRDIKALSPNRKPVVLVVGGGTIGSGLEALYQSNEIDVIAFDVFPSKHTHFVADGHTLPLTYNSVDAVIVQAVLEHVLDPQDVVAEIWRVLKPNGLVYADTPFLQHVHEGPFDFTRFTESGHRWLFKRFARIDSGVVAGVGTTLTWSVAQAIRSVIPVRGVSRLVHLLMRPIEMLVDRFGNPGHALDGANSVYFYGSKSYETLKPRDILSHYQGAQRRPERST